MDYNLIYNPNYDEIKLPFLKVKIVGKKVWTLLVWNQSIRIQQKYKVIKL